MVTVQRQKVLGRRFDVNPIQIQMYATRRLMMMSIPLMKLKKKKKTMMKTFRAKSGKKKQIQTYKLCIFLYITMDLVKI